MTRTTASTIYHVSPPTVAMILAEGAWTDDDDYKLGGYFATPLDKDVYVSLHTTDMTVTASGASGTPIGKMISEPQGKHSELGRQGTVLLFGTHVLEVEIATNSDSISVGGYVTFGTTGGTFAEGVWTKDASANGTRALAAYTTGSAAGTSIPVLFGAVSF